MEHARLCDRVLCSLPYSFIAVNIQDPDTKVQEFMDSKPLLSDFETQIKYYQVSYFLLFVEICPSAYLSVWVPVCIGALVYMRTAEV